MRYVRYFALTIIIVFVINLWSFIVYHSAKGGQQLGKLTGPIITFASYPKLLIDAFSSINSEFQLISNTYIKSPENFESKNELSYDLFAMNAYWDIDKQNWIYYLMNLRNEELVYTWEIKSDDLEKLNFDNLANNRPYHTLITEDKSIIIKFFNRSKNSQNGYYVIKLDSLSNILWSNSEARFHHSTEMDADGYVWIPSAQPLSMTFDGTEQTNNYNEYDAIIKNSDFSDIYFRDDYFTKIDPRDGKIIYSESVSKILIENGFQTLLYSQLQTQFDPIHLNDIQPVLKDGPFWKKGDLFLSLRNISTVLLFRPSTKKIIWLKTGPFLNQHDVDIVNDSTLSIFSNNHIHQLSVPAVRKYMHIKQTDKNYLDTLLLNKIYTYNFQTDKFSSAVEGIIKNERLNTLSEGLCEFLPNGDIFIDESNEGKIFIVNDQEVKLRKVFKSSMENRIHLTNWVRIYTKLPWNL